MATEEPRGARPGQQAGRVTEETWLRQLAEAIPGFVIVVGRDGLVRYFGGLPEPFDASNALGLELMSLVPPGSREQVAEALSEALAGRTTSLEVEAEGITGMPATYWSTYAPMGKGPPHDEVVVLSLDMTERQRMAAELAEANERFDQMAQHIDDVFWMTDPTKSRMLYISPAYERIWGRACDALYTDPRSWLDAIHPDDRDAVVEAAMTKQTAGTYDEQYRIVRPDGEQRWIRDRAFPVRDDKGEIYRITGVAQDITASKRRQAEHAQAERELARAEELEQMLFATSHTLRTPLRHIVSFLQLIERDAGDSLPPETRDQFNHVYEGGQELTRLLDALRDYAQALTREPRRDPVEPGRSLSYAEATVRAKLGERAPHLDVGELPRVLADEDQLEMVFTHVLENAARFHGDAPPRVRVTANRSNERVRISLADNGVGIDPLDVERVFRLFERRPDADGVLGVGLGLTLCKRLVEANGGRMWIAPGEAGSVVELTLPAAE